VCNALHIISPEKGKEADVSERIDREAKMGEAKCPDCKRMDEILNQLGLTGRPDLTINIAVSLADIAESLRSICAELHELNAECDCGEEDVDLERFSLI